MRVLLSAASLLALSTVSAGAEEVRTFEIWQSSDAAKSIIAIAASGENGPFAAAAGADEAALDLLASDEASAAIAELRARTAAKVAMAETAVAEETGPVDGKKMKVKKSKKKHNKHLDHASHSPEDHAAALAAEAPAEKAPETDIETVTETVVAEAAPDAVASPADAPHKIVLIKAVKADGKEEKQEVRRVIKLDAAQTDADLAKLIEEARADLNAEGDLAVEQGVLGANDADAALLGSAKGGKVIVIDNRQEGAASRLVSISGADAEGARAFIDRAGLDDAEKAKLKAELGL